jgi:hypothetical protein
VRRAVIVFWNVNARTEFVYWEYGERVVSFQTPDERRGSGPDRLLEPMAATVGLSDPCEAGAPVAEYYARTLVLADQITGRHLGPDFLHTELVVAEVQDDD